MSGERIFEARGSLAPVAGFAVPPYLSTIAVPAPRGPQGRGLEGD
jgi:hypothetical protein